jgi:hypothetical protein
MGIAKRYGYCICHNAMSSLNAKGLCPIGAKERHEKSALSKGFTIKKKDDECNERSLEKRMPIRSVESKKIKINNISKVKVIELAELAKIKKCKISLQGTNCELCGKSGEVDLFHIIGVGDKKHSTNETNLLLSCRFCHLVWGANDWAKIVKFKNFNEIMERLKSLDEGKYWKLWHKIEKHVIEQYFKTGDKTEIERLGIKFIKPL